MSDHYAIKVNVQPEYLQEHSTPEKNHFVFAYHITIRNQGKTPAQLISRHWIITDANERVEEVRGEGVIGEQPIIQPSGQHQYSSFCVLETSVGCMQGSYQMLDQQGETFETSIKAFTLAIPGSLH